MTRCHSIVAGRELAAAIALVGALGGCATPSLGSSATTVPGYHVAAEVRLPGDTSRFDYQVLDPSRHRLFIAHLGASEVIAFDTARQTVAGVVRDVAGVHGLAVAPELGRLFASATDRHEVVAIDEERLQVIGSADGGDYPDGIAYVPASKTLLVSDEHGGGDAVIDAVAMSRIGFVALGSDAGNSQFDARTGNVLVASHGGELVQVDPASRSVARRITLDGCDTPHGLQIDSSPRLRAYVACAGNAKLLVVDIAGGRIDSQFDIATDPDVLALDPTLGRLYVASESSRIDVFDIAGSRVIKLGEGAGGPDSHTVAVDPSSHRVYLPLTDVGGHPVLRELVPAA